MKSIVGQCLKKLLATQGYSLVPTKKWEEYKKVYVRDKIGGPAAKHLVKLLDTYPVDCVFDVGANDGGFAQMMRTEVGYQGWIISFEPLVEIAEELAKKAAADPKWEVMTDALGRDIGEKEFHQMAGDVFSSFYLPDPSQPAKYAESNKVLRSMAVKVNTINQLWPQIQKRLGVKTMLLKMDTQGFDSEVFAGADRCFDDIPLVMSEISFIRLYKEAQTFQESLDTFAAAGYVPAMLNPISYDDRQAAIEMDAILVRAKRPA